jgi:hypothetical protein
MLKKIQVNTAICGVFVLASLFYFFESMKLGYWSGQFAPGPGFIPRWAGGIMAILSIIAFISSFREKSITLAEILPKERSCRINLYVCWGGLLFFVLLVKRIGFLPTSFVLLSALFSRGTNWKKAIFVGAIVTICCFVVFKILLQVQIPTNKFGW